MMDYNPVILKFELLSQGAIISESTKKMMEETCKLGFAIGAVGKHALDAIIKGKKIYVGIPIGPFVSSHITDNTPFCIEIHEGVPVVIKKPARLGKDNKWTVIDPGAKGEVVAELSIPPRPAYYDLSTSSGLPMRNVMPMAADFTGGTISSYCHYWGHYDPEYTGMSCRYCGIGVNLRKGRDLPNKSIDDFLETLAEARKFPLFRHGPVFAGGAYPGPDRGHRLHAKYIAAIKNAYPDNWLRLTIAPPDDVEYVDMLMEAGTDLVGYNYEVFDPQLFAKMCPGKVRDIEKGTPGHVTYDAMLRHVVETYGRNRAHANLILGLEPVASTVAGIRHLAAMGVIPTVFVFVPLLGTYMEKEATPTAMQMLYVYQKIREIVEQTHHLDTGCAGCQRMMVNTKSHDGLDALSPAITPGDLERAGFPPHCLHELIS